MLCRAISSWALPVSASASAGKVVDSAFASSARTRSSIGDPLEPCRRRGAAPRRSSPAVGAAPRSAAGSPPARECPLRPERVGPVQPFPGRPAGKHLPSAPPWLTTRSRSWSSHQAGTGSAWSRRCGAIAARTSRAARASSRRPVIRSTSTGCQPRGQSRPRPRTRRRSSAASTAVVPSAAPVPTISWSSCRSACRTSVPRTAASALATSSSASGTGTSFSGLVSRWWSLPLQAP